MVEALIVGLSIAALVAVFGIVAYRSWDDRRKSNDFYLDTVIAYKVGTIQKKAKDNGVELVYPDQKDEFIDGLEKELEGDLNRID